MVQYDYRPAPSGPVPSVYFRTGGRPPAQRLHAWRSYPYRQKHAPLAGFYAVGLATWFAFQGEELPKGITE